MEHAKEIFNGCAAALGVVASLIFGGWDLALRILLTLVVIDYITGMTKSGAKGELSSSVGWNGLYRKGVIFLVIVLAHQLDLITGTATPVFRIASTYFYIANEAISITENIAMIGVPLPDFLVKGLKTLKTNVNEMTPEVKPNEKN